MIPATTPCRGRASSATSSNRFPPRSGSTRPAWGGHSLRCSPPAATHSSHKISWTWGVPARPRREQGKSLCRWPAAVNEQQFHAHAHDDLAGRIRAPALQDHRGRARLRRPAHQECSQPDPTRPPGQTCRHRETRRLRRRRAASSTAHCLAATGRRRPQRSATAAVVAAAAASASRVREVQRPSPRAGPSGCGGRCALRADLDCRAAVHLALPPLLGAGGRGAVQCTHGPVLAGTPGTEWGHNPSWGPADPKGSAVGSSCASSNARLPPRAARTRPTAAPPGPSLRVSLAASSWLREIAAAGHAQLQSAQWTPGRLWVEPALPCYHRPPRAGLHARNFDASIDGFDASNGSSDASNDGFDVSNDSFDASNDGFDASNEGSAHRITVSMRRMTVSMSRITVSMRRKKVSRRCKTVAMRRTKVSMRRMKVEALIHYLRPSLFLIDCLVNWILVV